MSWNRDLTQFEAQTLHDLHSKGYRAVDKKHMIHFKEIYDFISRFADPMYASTETVGVKLRMEGGPIPPETMRIVNTIGIKNLFQYFSPNVYEKKYMNFCEKLIRTKRINSDDYIAEGIIVADEYEIKVSQ